MMTTANHSDSTDRAVLLAALLTPAQIRTLSRLRDGRWHFADGRSAERLLRLGLIEENGRSVKRGLCRITDAGRAVLQSMDRAAATQNQAAAADQSEGDER